MHLATHCNSLYHTATHCNSLQLTATHCNIWMPQVRAQIDHTNVSVMQNTISCSSLHLTATHCKSLQITATGERRDRGRRDAWHADRGQRDGWDAERLYLGCPQRPLPPGMHSQKSPIYPHKSRATQCNTLQRTATHCNQRTATYLEGRTRPLPPATHLRNTPIFLQKSPIFWQRNSKCVSKSRRYPSKRPISLQKSPVFPQKHL